MSWTEDSVLYCPGFFFFSPCLSSLGGWKALFPCGGVRISFSEKRKDRSARLTFSLLWSLLLYGGCSGPLGWRGSWVKFSNYRSIFVPTPICAHELWVMIERTMSQIQGVELSFLSRVTRAPERWRKELSELLLLYIKSGPLRTLRH